MTDRDAQPPLPKGVDKRRSVWGFADQAVWSLGNLALTLLVATSVSGSDFGAFSAVYGILLVSLGLIGSLTHESMLLVSAKIQDELRGGSLFAAVLLGALVSVLLLAAAPFFGSAGPAMRGFAAVAPILALFETLRGQLNLQGRTRPLFFLDLLWTLLTFGSILAVGSFGGTSMELAMAWGLTAIPSALLALRIISSAPRLRGLCPFLASRASTGLSFGGEHFVSSGLAQLIAPIVAATAGLPAAGVLRLIQVAFGPFTTLASGARIVLTPQLRDRRELGGTVSRLALTSSAGLSVFAVALGTALWLLPVDRGVSLAGDLWEEVRPLVYIGAGQRALSTLALAGAMSARALGLVVQSRRIRFAVSVLSVTAVYVGSSIAGVRGALFGLVGVQVVAAMLWWAVVEPHDRATSGHNELRPKTSRAESAARSLK